MNNLKVFNSIANFTTYRNSFSQSQKVGFVPTMGALHDGHAELIKRCAAENDLCILSIFVNPTQFNNPEDLDKYPRTPEEDLLLAAKCGATAVLTPAFNEIYADNYRFQLSENSFSKKLCGLHRPGHFDGVLTVVMKLLQIVRAEKAYFGEKDFQQFLLIAEMAKTFFLQTQVIGCKTVREADGLAMSSRNVRLSAEGRKKAPLLYQALIDFKENEKAVGFLNANGIEVEYLEELYNRKFIAAHIDGVRLIDNVEIQN